MKKLIVLIKLLKPYRYLVVAGIFSITIFACLGLVMPWMLKIIIDQALGNSDLGLLFGIIGTILIVYIIREIFFYISHYLVYYISQRLMFDVRKQLFEHLQNLSLRFYNEYRTGKLVSNIISDVSRIEQLIFSSMIVITVNTFVILFITAFMFYINARLALICMALVPLQFVNFMYFRKSITADNMTLSEKMSEISANLAETINGAKIVKSFSKERAESRLFVSHLRPTFHLTISVLMKGVYLWIIADILSVLSSLLALGAGGVMVSKGQISVGEFVAFYTYLGMLLNPIIQLSGLSTTISNGLVGAARIKELLDTIPEVKEAKNPLKLDEIKGRIVFDKVSFQYREVAVVKNFSLEINPGQKIALVGPSGSGKSTIANLILRFYDVNTGKITVDGHDIRDLQFESYRSRVGVVFQDPFLFSGTIKENIAYAKNDASEKDIMQAAKLANIEEFIHDLEKGYDTEIGENGVMISGGQKQRIAIARAILKNPRILILDEATSALDTISEYLVQDALDNLMRGRTTIIIAHRLSTIKNADLIVVMENGEIKQIGSHKVLLEQKGLYHDLYLKQEAMQIKGRN